MSSIHTTSPTLGADLATHPHASLLLHGVPGHSEPVLLEKHEVLGTDFVLVDGEKRAVVPTGDTYWSGAAKGVWLRAGADGVFGFAHGEADQPDVLEWSPASAGKRGSTGLGRRSMDLSTAGNFTCHAHEHGHGHDHHDHDDHGDHETHDESLSLSLSDPVRVSKKRQYSRQPSERTVTEDTIALKVAIELDAATVRMVGNSQATLQRYASDIVSYTSTMMSRELRMTVAVSHLAYYTAGQRSPYPATTNINALLSAISGYYNDASVTAQIDRSAAILLTGENVGGGIAYLDTVGAHSNYVNRRTPSSTGVVGVDSSAVSDPAVRLASNVFIFAHELGHIIWGPHTHEAAEFFGGSNIDTCATSSQLPRNCPDGQLGCGTIMSYCANVRDSRGRYNSFGNVAWNFGGGLYGNPVHPYGTNPERIPRRIRLGVQGAARQYPAAFGPVANGNVPQPAPTQAPLPPAPSPDDTVYRCGNGVCQRELGEDCNTCRFDCPRCPEPEVRAVCGDGICSTGEDCARCMEDCGECRQHSTCGDGACFPTEVCQVDRPCVDDCLCNTQTPIYSCGDGQCSYPETEQNCPLDCDQRWWFCGDGVCQRAYESESQCARDCVSRFEAAEGTSSFVSGGAASTQAESWSLTKSFVVGAIAECQALDANVDLRVGFRLFDRYDQPYFTSRAPNAVAGAYWSVTGFASDSSVGSGSGVTFTALEWDVETSSAYALMRSNAERIVKLELRVPRFSESLNQETEVVLYSSFIDFSGCPSEPGLGGVRCCSCNADEDCAAPLVCSGSLGTCFDSAPDLFLKDAEYSLLQAYRASQDGGASSSGDGDGLSTTLIVLIIAGAVVAICLAACVGMAVFAFVMKRSRSTKNHRSAVLRSGSSRRVSRRNTAGGNGPPRLGRRSKVTVTM
jgi:hypothetical protein